MAEDAPAPGFVATREALRVDAKSEAGMATLTWVSSTIVVVRKLPFHVTTTPGTKLLPVNVSSVLPEPCEILVIELEVRTAGAFRFSSWGTTAGPRSR